MAAVLNLGVDVIRAIVDAVDDDQRESFGSQVVDRETNLSVLPYALLSWNKTGSLDMVEELLKIFPNELYKSVRDGEYPTPLHFSMTLENRNKVKMWRLLLDGHRDALLIPDVRGRLPFVLAAESDSSLGDLYWLLHQNPGMVEAARGNLSSIAEE